MSVQDCWKRKELYLELIVLSHGPPLNLNHPWSDLQPPVVCFCHRIVNILTWLSGNSCLYFSLSAKNWRKQNAVSLKYEDVYDFGWRQARLTFCSNQASVVPDWTAVFKDKDCDGHDSQTHDEHHHPDRWTVRFYRERGHRSESDKQSRLKLHLLAVMKKTLFT